MGRKGHKSRKKHAIGKNGHHPKKKKTKHHKKHHAHTHTHTDRDSRPRPSEIYHDNCCRYKTHPRPLLLNQVNLATQCPSRTIAIAASVPLLLHPIRRKVVRLPETVVMHMRNTEDARRVADSFKNTLIQAHVPVPDVEDGESLERLRQVDLRPRHVYPKRRKRPSYSTMDLDKSFQ
ncbi:uncharacterized protein LOC108038756 [Drosophila rhopaloa]|uniref:Uncharacterized protein LOC108038756 n=1 Tax=Drosophila rhopaloa TaxID=1041015 RepID=A0A6P4E762_DRORH|nr:uncharacterized protein LOC108038756 [Drosophila rhopaloa]